MEMDGDMGNRAKENSSTQMLTLVFVPNLLFLIS